MQRLITLILLTPLFSRKCGRLKVLGILHSVTISDKCGYNNVRSAADDSKTDQSALQALITLYVGLRHNAELIQVCSAP